MFPALDWPEKFVPDRKSVINRTRLAYLRPQYINRFICNDHKLATVKITPPSVVVENYLVPCDTTEHFDRL